MSWNDTVLVFTASVIIFGVLFDLIARLRKRNPPQRTFKCFYCNERTTRRDGYCCDIHRDEDLRNIAAD